MALPADFSKIFGSTATGGLTPIGDVNYAKGWEFVGANPPTKNDFSYLQNLSDMKSQWLYSNKLQRTDPFGDIKSDGEEAISTALKNLGLPELLDKKFDKTGGTIKAISAAVNIQTEWSQSGYFQISGEDGRTIHQLGKLNSDNSLELRNVAEGGTLAVSGDGARFNGRLLGFINEALNYGNGWWRDSSTGLLIQWGTTPAGSDTRQVSFPIPFKSWPHAVVHFDGGWYHGGGATWGAENKSLTGFTGRTSVALEGGAFIAIGI